VTKADGIVFLIIGSILLAFSLVMAFGAWCQEKVCKKKNSTQQVSQSPEQNETSS